MLNLDKFNEQQKNAITNNSPYIKVIAGAGSGKTAVLTNRIAYLIQEKQVNPKNILAITFTNKAAKEMKSRVEKLLNTDNFSGVITTFHSFCLRVLREDINKLGYSKDFIIIDKDDQKSILKTLNKKFNFDKEIFKVQSILTYISNRKNHYQSMELDEFTKGIYEDFYEAYQEYLKKNNALDFDDLIIKCVELFKQDSIILDKWRYRFHYLHVDEFQDTNYQQYQLIKLLGKDLNVFVVGDPDQTIYTWRGAKIQYILEFEKDFDNSETIKLEYNYRSQKNILDLANSLIINNENRIEKSLISTINPIDKIEHFIGETSYDEALYVVDKINEIIANQEDVNYDDFAILYRSNYVSRVFEQALTKADIDYKIIGGIRFFERKEIKDLLAYLKVIALKDDISLLRIINLPKRKIGEKTLDKLSKEADLKQISLYQLLEENLDDLQLSKIVKENIEDLFNFIKSQKDINEPAIILENIVNKYNVLEDYHQSSIEYQSKRENINELISFVKNQNDDLTTFLQDITIDNEESEDSKQQVSLMSMHGAKGLEFKYVFVAYLCDGIFPSSQSLESLNLEEERRLAYVAFTRAEKGLFLLSHIKNDYYQPMATSMFVKELDQTLLEKSGRLNHDANLPPQMSKMKTFMAQNKTENIEYDVNDVVYHPLFNKGVIIKVENEVLTIAFEQKVGIKMLNKNFVKKM